MIFTVLIFFGSTLLALIAGLLPAAQPLPPEFTSNMAALASYFGYFNFLFDIPSLLTALGIVVAFEVITTGVNIFRWFVRGLPFINSRI